MSERIIKWSLDDYDRVWAAVFANSFHEWIKTMPNTPDNRKTCVRLAIAAAFDAVTTLRAIAQEQYAGTESTNT
jgi:hypothetical protein